MSIDISQFYQVFFDEADELLAEKERLLLAIDVGAPDPEDLNAIFRTAHSIKGGASTFGFSDMSEVTHFLESLLDRIRKGEVALTSAHVDAFLAAKDILKMQLDGHRNGAPVDQEAVADMQIVLQALSRAAPPVPAAASASAAAPAAALAQQAAQSPSLRCYRIELPSLGQREREALAAELGLLGPVTLLPLAGERHALTVTTGKGLDAIVDICAFVLDPDQLAISETALPDGELQPGVSPTVGDAVSAADARARIEHAQGYGFFDPLEPQAEAQTQTGDAGRGYGFFQPIEQIRAMSAGAPAAALRTIDSGDRADPAEHGEHAGPRREAPRSADKGGAGAESSSIRVSIEKVDQLINLIGELVITQAMIEQRTDSLDPVAHERLLGSISQLTRNTRELQESVMSIRMMPMDFVFSRFPRMVRDLTAKLGKRVDFITHGAATELDKGLIERIVDPLTHLVRNSIDHGIEMPDARAAAGKSEAGRLFLSAGHQGGNIVIEVSDDGAGLNRERIMGKAREQGMALADDMADSEVWQLIFAPGFSTAETVTDVSGRGVGMDVVKRNITAMGGSVDIRSAKGFGTTISIALPLTLAILDGMSIRVGQEVYILPLGFVVESLQPKPADIKEISGKGRVIKVRGEYLPLIALHQLFGIAPRCLDPAQGIVVILEADGRKAGLLVDDLVGQQQVVVKNIESNYRKVTGISGATILGDGGVSLILDVSALVRSSRQLADESTFVN
jgi:two-component system, chemotaxis family, sensor kinase CheA